MDYNKVLGCLLGGACGDALGAPVEFWSWREIKGVFGKAGITEFVTGDYFPGAVTDDTQMTLFTAEALLRQWDTDSRVRSEIGHAYLRWLRTQSDAPDIAADEDGLLNDLRMYAARAPGMTCLSALNGLKQGKKVSNDSKGCGGVMRAAPCGFISASFGWAADMEVFDLGVMSAKITHKHPSGYYPAGCLAVIINRLLHGDVLPDAVEDALIALRNCTSGGTGHVETELALHEAVLLAHDGPMTPARIEKFLGGGWTGEECLAIAVACALTARTFREGVQTAVNHSGDSDSTGAVAGNILGAVWGATAIPDTWADRVELSDVMEKMATETVEAFG